jgi:hypothetical protein
MSAFSNYLENKLIDHVFRGQVYTPPANIFVGLLTASADDASPGTEVSGGSYARVSVPGSLAAWAGTQSAGSTAASSGTSGATSNNGVVTFPAPSANWGSASHFGLFDAASGGNLLFYGALSTAKTINNGDPAPTFPVAALGVTLA